MGGRTLLASSPDPLTDGAARGFATPRLFFRPDDDFTLLLPQNALHVVRPVGGTPMNFKICVCCGKPDRPRKIVCESCKTKAIWRNPTPEEMAKAQEEHSRVVALLDELLAKSREAR